MPAKKKKFIDKKNAVTFHLVHRSQKDPLQADENAPKHVLLPSGATNSEEVQKRRDEQAKFGVFFDDDYDYLQHLRDVDELNRVEPIEERFRIAAKEKPSLKRKNDEIAFKDDSERVLFPGAEARSTVAASIMLPSTVFASETETEVGMLNKAAPLRGPQPDWDPDIVAALDDDFDYADEENLLDDDFILKANEDCGDDRNVDNRSDDGDCDYASDDVDYSDDDQLGSLDGPASYDSEDTKTRFTNYSVTSSAMGRNDGLALLDDRFEVLFEQYDDAEIGALEQDDIDGAIGACSAVLNDALDEFERTRQQTKMKDAVEKADDVVAAADDDESDEETLERMVVRAEPTERWDCESILSTYSTLYNRPKTIEEPRRIKLDKSGMPSGVLKSKRSGDGLTLNEIEKEFNASRPVARAPTSHARGHETPDERRARKHAIKDERRERRIEKKATKDAFKKEKTRQDKELINLRANLQGIKMT
ncbi:protein LTV1 homolog [Tubulanus polymorphus]|uniref:protein LTV1 homolog n=1 Tax=Tubulanus polymorphus TaxID=672921 RepID=UPI003DA51F60